MSPSRRNPDSLSAPTVGGNPLDRICDAFEADWRAGKVPQMEDFLADLRQPAPPELFKELLLLDWAYRRRAGEPIHKESYCQRFPAYLPVIEAAWLAAASEQTAAISPSTNSPASSRRRHAEENLLFGILAVQMDFIAPDQLIAAMHGWTLEKTTPLADILLRAGAIQPADRAVLDQVISRHLEHHQHDTGQCLRSIEGTAALRDDLQRIADPELDASLALLGSREGETSLPTGEGSGAATLTDTGAAQAADQAGRFYVLRLHAKGALGEVFVARDEELQREVALKEIQSRHAKDDQCRSRFLVEARITGSLEHPGIVPVYGMGQHADGRPYYAMRLIRGESLKHAIERFHAAKFSSQGSRTLEFRKLLTRFIDVCNTVSYAHSRGVLHRDLKPSNIMLGKYGETLVVDWGLAKLVGTAETRERSQGDSSVRLLSALGSSETVAGSALGTPAYMSPEQAAGRIDELGPATDIYSLGATLYCLLTGQAPIDGTDLGELLIKAQEGAYPRPSALEPRCPKALEAVCLKAMAREPADRYPSVGNLAADIERFLADEPVSAWKEPRAIRLRRWARRHRSIVASVSVLFLVALISLSAGTVLVSHERATTETAIAKATAAAQTAQSEAQTTKAVSGFLTGMFEEPAPLTFFGVRVGKGNADPASQALLARGAERLLAGDLDDQPAVKAAMLTSIGKAYTGIGYSEKATPLLEQALEIKRQFFPGMSPEIALAADELAYARLQQGRSIEAQLLATEALTILEKNYPRSHGDVLGAKVKLGVILGMTGRRLNQAKRLWSDILEVRRQALPSDDPALAEALFGLAGTQLALHENPLAIASLVSQATRILA